MIGLVNFVLSFFGGGGGGGVEGKFQLQKYCKTNCLSS